MSSAWMTAGMAIRMAQDLGLFRDVEKWFVPIQRFSHEEKQTRKRVWWACVILGAFFFLRAVVAYQALTVVPRAQTATRLRTLDVPVRSTSATTTAASLPRTSRTSTSSGGRSGSTEPSSAGRPRAASRRCPKRTCNSCGRTRRLGLTRSALSTPRRPSRSSSTASVPAGLSVSHAVRLTPAHAQIISNIYAIRIRVLGQSSETLLSLLDQSLASWFLALPPQLQYNPASKNMPPPHVSPRPTFSLSSRR